jgi:predicted GNAT superfamily acetyltransferase
MEWRLAEREAFQRAFGRGYVATDFVVRTGEGTAAFYVLTPAEESGKL